MDINRLLEDIKSASPKKVIIDTDAFNEVDDQFAIVFALSCPSLEVLSINAAPFFNGNSTSYGDGMERSYLEIKRVLAAYKKDCDIPVYKGSCEEIEKNGGKPVQSPAAENIIRTARESSEPVFVLGLGAATNIASAIMLAPDIKEKIVVVWLGANSLDNPGLGEFNLVQDYIAGQVLLDSGVPLVLCPAWNVTCVLYCTMAEIRESLEGKSQVCELLWQLICEFHRNAGSPDGYGRTIWDVAAPAILAAPECGSYRVIPAPILSDERVYKFDDSRHEIIYLEKLDRDEVFRHVWKGIASLECSGKYLPRSTVTDALKNKEA